MAGYYQRTIGLFLMRLKKGPVAISQSDYDAFIMNGKKKARDRHFEADSGIFYA